MSSIHIWDSNATRSHQRRGVSWDGGGGTRRASTLLIGLLVAALAVSVTPSDTAESVWSGAGWQDASTIGSYDPWSYEGSMTAVVNLIGASAFWDLGYTGRGVDIALIDTGVTGVQGLSSSGKLVNGPDLSFEGSKQATRSVDLHGHGTHMAGIMAGSDLGLDFSPDRKDPASHFIGVAPGARVVNVKVGDRNGAVDVSQVIAAIDWVVEHRNTDGLDIGVLALAYGTDSTQAPDVDPLAHAVERAWKAGIVVVVAAGNDGNASPLRNPATNPYVIAVGAVDGHRMNGSNTQPVPDFTPCGGRRTVDLVAPGGSIVSLRAPGSSADTAHAEARVTDRFFLGSGTSQAAAVVAGAAALVVDQRPNATPDQVKALLVGAAEPLRKESTACQGAGVLNLWGARSADPGRSGQRHAASKGTGSLEAARGSAHLTLAGIALTGEKDIFGRSFSSNRWARSTDNWDGGSWNGSTWTGTSFSGLSWSGVSWSGLSWSGLSWSGLSWSGVSWSGLSWSGDTWS